MSTISVRGVRFILILCPRPGAIRAPSDERTEESVTDLVKGLRDGTSFYSLEMETVLISSRQFRKSSSTVLSLVHLVRLFSRMELI